MSLGMLANVYTMVRKRCGHTTERKKSYIDDFWAFNIRMAERTSHLCFSLFQKGFKPLLSSAPLVVVAHYKDDMVPVELAHQVEPHMGLVGVGRDCAQEGQVDTLERSVIWEMKGLTLEL